LDLAGDRFRHRAADRAGAAVRTLTPSFSITTTTTTRKPSMKLTHSLALTLPLASSWAMAADLSVKFELPQLNVAEYHKPYVAIWIERPDQSVASTLSVLYDVRKRDNGGAKWVKELRTWWRKAGRDMTLPMDGVSGATRPAGQQALNFAAARNGIDKLPA